MIECLFPIPVGRYTFERPFSNVELDVINSQKKNNNLGNLISDNKFILEDPNLQLIKNSLETYINEYFQEVYSPKGDAKLVITQSWLNWTGNTQFHHKHQHSNSFISGVLYIYAKKELDKIMFFRDEYRQFEIIPKEYNILNSDSWWLSVGAKDNVLYPTSQPHSVTVVESDYVRLSLSFNTFIEGEIGNVEGPTILTFKK